MSEYECSKCGVTRMDRVRNEVHRSGVTRVGWSSRAECVEVVNIWREWSRTECKENSKIRCERKGKKRDGWTV